MKMREFMNMNFDEIQEVCIQHGLFSMDYDDMEECINNSEDLTNWAIREGVHV